jgi:hypothetical protein
MASIPEERRGALRIGFGVVVRVGPFPRASSIARLRDVSSSGAFFETVLPDRGNPLRVVLDIEQSTEAWRLELEAHLVRQEPDGVGVMWGELSSAIVAPLIGLLTSRHSRPHTV